MRTFNCDIKDVQADEETEYASNECFLFHVTHEIKSGVRWLDNAIFTSYVSE